MVEPEQLSFLNQQIMCFFMMVGPRVSVQPEPSGQNLTN
ncbi:hypothetical protein EC09BKT78844_1114 [Escherichia coli 09BKT078844]|nr:hypothetical protein EC09BKT78844_1114 [Escherichia coli 09BKT078844]